MQGENLNIPIGGSWIVEEDLGWAAPQQLDPEVAEYQQGFYEPPSVHVAPLSNHFVLKKRLGLRNLPGGRTVKVSAYFWRGKTQVYINLYHAPD